MINTWNRLWISLIIIYGITITLLPVVHAENKELTENKIVLKNKVSKDLKILKIRLTWKLVPDAVMYDLIITKGNEINSSDIVFVVCGGDAVLKSAGLASGRRRFAGQSRAVRKGGQS